MRTSLAIVMNYLHRNQGQRLTLSRAREGRYWVLGGMDASTYHDGRARGRVVKTTVVLVSVPEPGMEHHLHYSHDPKRSSGGLDGQTTKHLASRRPCKDFILSFILYTLRHPSIYSCHSNS